MLNKHRLERLEDKMIQKQISGDNSTQTQVGTFVYNQGISEERVRDVFEEMIPQALEKYTKAAYQISDYRIRRLETATIPRMIKEKDAVNAFADPAFQILLRKAQQTAAATEREDDYALLSELLMCHVQKGEDRKNRMGISKAIEIVDDIDNDALCGLTVAHAINRFSPMKGGVCEGLEILDGLFSKLLYMELPNGKDWIDHIDVLGAARMSSFGSFKRFREYYSEKMEGYVCVGIKKDSEEYGKAVELVQGIGIDDSVLVSNELLDGYVRLALCSKESIRKLYIANKTTQTRVINDEEIKVLEEVWGLYSSDEKLRNIVRDEFIKLWDSYDSLAKVRMWWERIPCSFEITKVGTVLAHTNAKRCDPTLPDLM